MRNLKRVLALALALVMMLGMMITASAASYDFDDAAEIKYVEAVEVLTGIGVLEGDDKGNFNANDVLTREQAAKIIAYIMLGEKNAEKLGTNTQIFADVAAGRWSAGYIAYCANVGILAGKGDGTFGPTDPLTGVAFAKMLLVAAGYDAAVEGYVGAEWDANVATDAIGAGIDVKGVVLQNAVTREQAAQMVLQALEMNTVDYITGNVVGHIGPYTVPAEKVDYNDSKDGIQQFCEKYFADLEKELDDTYDIWGRPIDYTWEYKNDTISTVLYAKVAEYTEAVTECDIAEELGIETSAAIKKATLNGEDIDLNNNQINATATKVAIGAQGRLTEIYKVGKTYVVAQMDQFLAKVDAVSEVEYDRNGHIEEYAELDLVICTEGDVEIDVTLIDDEDWEYSKGDMLLVKHNFEKDVTVIIDYADTLVGAQTAFTKNADVHIIEDTEYNDAVQFNHDETAARDTNDYTWYFDTYGNVIGATKIATTSTYGVISSIYWKDSNNGENGYAVATITYPDGTSETATIYSIDGVELEGIEGNAADYAAGDVSSTKQYNKTEYTNKALYKLVNSKNGLKLTTTAKLAADTTIETGVPALNDDLNAGKSTQFLVWNGKTYETYTGIRNVPTYEGTVNGYYVDARNDEVADIIFVIKPVDPTDSQTVLYYFDGRLTEKTYLKDSAVDYYTLTGGYVNGEKETIAFAADDEALMDAVSAEKGILMVLDIEDGYVVGYTEVTTEASVKIAGKTYYAIYAGVAADADVVDEILMDANGVAYDVEDLEKVITYKYDLTKTLKKDGTAELYVVYTVGKTGEKTAETVYIAETHTGK